MSISKRIKDQIEALDVNRNMKDLMLDILEAQSRGSKKLMIKRFRSIWISRIKRRRGVMGIQIDRLSFVNYRQYGTCEINFKNRRRLIPSSLPSSRRMVPERRRC